jgi:hypothetical protein
VVLNDVNDLRCLTLIQGIGADGFDTRFAGGSIQRRLIIGEISPGGFFQPQGIAGEPQATIASRQCLITFLNPAVKNPTCFKSAVTEIPLRVRNDFDLSSFQI